MPSPERILIIRNDKIGDFMLAWPAIALLKKQYPDAEITALVPAYTAALAEQCEWIDKILIDDRQDSAISDVLSLARRIRDQKFDASISLFSQTRTSLALMLAGIRARVGPASKIAQFFLNRRLRQRRSESAKPESEYNVDLVRYFIEDRGDSVAQLPSPPYLNFEPEETATLDRSFRTKNRIDEHDRLVFIHPGTGGSAINLSLEQYAELALALAERQQIHIVITAGPGELDIAQRLSGMIATAAHSIHHSPGDLLDFCRLIATCDLFISGSTGPLHIAGALDRPTVAFYPAKRSATSLRWRTLNSQHNRLAFSDTGDGDRLIVDTAEVMASIIEQYGF